MRKSSATPPASRKHPQRKDKASASPQRGPEGAAATPNFEGGGSRPSSPFAALTLRRSRFSSVPLVELKHDTTAAEVVSPASVELPRRHVTFCSDSDSSLSGGGFCSMSDTMESFKEVSGGSPPLPSVRIKHITRNSEGSSRFPKLDECAHFHYDNVELGPISVVLCDGDDRGTDVKGQSDGDWWFCVQVVSNGKSWQVRRSLDNFQMLDRQLHRCVYDRKFSLLKEINAETHQDEEDALRTMLTQYLERFSHLAGSLINCGPVLNWLELDNRGNRLIVTDEAAINTPAVAAAYVTKRYASQATDEISLEVGDIISVIDMPPPDESSWWRGKKGFQVGFFPCECVEIIGDKVPQSIKVPKTPSKPVLRKHGKLIAFFRSFLLSRPSRRKLKQSGILKERVFGCDLGEHLMNTGRDIPLVLKCCTEFIEQYGIVDGIYRLSGVTSNIQKLRHAFDEDRVPNLLDEAILQDIHCVASLLKMYFRELPNPLLTFHLYDKFVSAVQADEDLRLLKLRDVVQQLPPPHYRSLEYLMRHLSKVAAHGFQTGMTPKNVAIVWAPNLLRSRDIENGGVGALHVVGVQAVLTEYLIRYTDIIFSEKMPIFPTLIVGEETPKKTRPKSLAISTPTKLLSLEEARSRALTSNLLGEHQKFIDVGGGEENLPIKYHTVIELPTRRRSMGKSKKSPSGWRSFFSRTWHSTSSSGRRKHRRERPKIGSPIFSEHSPLVLQSKAVTESEVSHTNTKKLRTVKSAESLFPMNTTSLHIAPNQVFSPVDKPPSQRDDHPINNNTATSPSLIKKSLTHIRSFSHDSYFERIPEYPEDELDQDDSIREDFHSKSSQNLSSIKSENDPEFKNCNSAKELPGSVESTPKRKVAQKQKLVSFDSEASSPKLQKISLKRLYHTLSSPPLIKRKEPVKTSGEQHQRDVLKSCDSSRKIKVFPRNRSEGSMKDETPHTVSQQIHRNIKSSVPSMDSTTHTSFETSFDDTTSAKDTVSVEVHKTLSDSSVFQENGGCAVKKYSRCRTEDSVESALLDDSMDTMNFSIEGTISDSVNLSQLLSFDSKNGDCINKGKQQSEFSIYPLDSSLMTPESPTGDNVSEIPSSDDSEANDIVGDINRQIQQTDALNSEMKNILGNHNHIVHSKTSNVILDSSALNKSDVLVSQTEQLCIQPDEKVESSGNSVVNLSPSVGDVLNRDNSFVGSIILSPPENFVDESKSLSNQKQKNDIDSKIRSEIKTNAKSPAAKPLERSMTEEHEICSKFVSGIAVSGSFAHDLFRVSNELTDSFQRKRNDKTSPTTPIEDSKRRFESEIGRLIVRDRQMKMEMEQIKAERQKCNKKELPDFEQTKVKSEKKFVDALDFRKSPVKTFECDKKKQLESDDLLKSLKDNLEERRNIESLFSHGYSCFARMESKPSVKELLSKFEGQGKEPSSLETFEHSRENSSTSPQHASSVFSNVQVINHNFSTTPTKILKASNVNQSQEDNQSSHNREHIFQTECVVRFPHPKLSSIIKNDSEDSYKNGALNSSSMPDSVGSNSWSSGQSDHRIKISNSRTNFLSSDNLTSPTFQDYNASFSPVKAPHVCQEQSQTQGNLKSTSDLHKKNGTQSVNKTVSQEFDRPFSTFKDTFDRANRMTYQMKKEFFQRELSQDAKCLRSPGAQEWGVHSSRLLSDDRKRHTQTRQRPKSVPPPVCRLSYVSEKPSQNGSFQGSQSIPKQNVPKTINSGPNGKDFSHTSPPSHEPPRRIKERAAMFERSLSFSGYADKRPYVSSARVQNAQSRSSAR